MTGQPKRFVIIPAGGVGARMGLPYPKQLAPFGGTTVIEHAVSLFGSDPVYLPVPDDHLTTFREKFARQEQVHILAGGDTRYRSVRNAYEALPPHHENDLIVVHDAARPFLDPATLAGAYEAAAQKGAVIYAAAAVDTIKRVAQDGTIVETLDRNRIFQAQTPQIFRSGLLRAAYLAYDEAPAEAPTDEARLLELAGIPVSVFESPASNRKLTHREDLNLLKMEMPRIGHGYDVHAFDEQRELYLGGVQIPGGPGLKGHSDADVALHALIDALLGAAGLGDIGQHFPDTDPAYAGIRSTELLRRVWTDLTQRGYRLGNADVTIQAQVPRLAPYISAMRETTADILGVAPDRVNYKATTTERLGFVGKKEGMAADAVAMLIGEATP